MVFPKEVDSFSGVRSLGKIFLYALFALVAGALAAPLVWHLDVYKRQSLPCQRLFS